MPASSLKKARVGERDPVPSSVLAGVSLPQRERHRKASVHLINFKCLGKSEKIC